MGRSLMIAAYMANLGAPDRPEKLGKQPPRPPGTVIWARCSHPDQLMSVETLDRKLAEDGDPIHIITTLLDWSPKYASRALPEPTGREAIRAFIAHWQPAMTVWVQGDFDPILMTEMRSADIKVILVDATGEGLGHIAGTWVPGSLKSLLSQFEAVLALDHFAADRLLRAGTPEETVLVTGAMEDCAPTLACDENERSEVARAIGTRPVWLAAGAQLNECLALCQAHQAASRSAHRLLLIVAPQNPVIGYTFAEDLRQLGFHVTQRSKEPMPTDVTQIYVIDTDDDLGLWYRVAPITYMGGSLENGGCRDPFEATALGSAVLYGPHVAPYQRHAGRLNAAGASRLLRSANDLGPAVEELLSTDKAAKLAHLAWDVTSHGANVTNRIAAYIQLRLEELVH